MYKLFRHLKSRKGFTMVELMIVITVIGILMAVAVPKLVTVREKAKKMAARVDVKGIQSSLELYYNDNEQYPLSTEGLRALAEEGLIKLKQINDPWKRPYKYRALPSQAGVPAQDYSLASGGPDGKPGNKDDVEADGHEFNRKEDDY